MARSQTCPSPSLHDRILVRDSSKLHLTPSRWRHDSRFVNAAGKPLSDHEPVIVDLSHSRL